MRFSKTQEAVMKVLSQSEGAMDSESIFLQLNMDGKKYSFAAVTHAIRILREERIILAVVKKGVRKKQYSLH